MSWVRMTERIPGRMLAAMLGIAALCASLAVPARAGVPDWAFYVYMGADYRDVQVPSLDDLEEMERVGSSGALAIVVQRDGARGAGMRRYLVERAAGPVTRRPATRPLEVHPEVDSGSARSLQDFLEWALPRFPARRRALVISGHSWGWKGIIQDQQHRSIIPLPALARAVEAARGRHGVDRFDLVVVDSCVTGGVEVAHELAGQARVAVFPPIEMPYAGMPWDRVLEQVARAPRTEGAGVARTMVREFVAWYQAREGARGAAFEPVALVAVDLDRAGGLFVALGRLGQAMAREGLRPSSRPRLLGLSGPDRILDVSELARELGAEAPDAVRPALRQAAHAVTRALGYPLPAAEAAQRVAVERARPFALDVEVRLDGSRAARPGPIPMPHQHGEDHGDGRGRVSLLRELLRMNPELAPEQIESARVEDRPGGVSLRLRLASAPAGARHRAAVRLGLGTSTGCRYAAPGEEREIAWPANTLVTRFLPGSPFLAEGHSGGTYPWRGLQICFAPEVPADHVVSGPDDYRRLSWDRATTWSRFLFGD